MELVVFDIFSLFVGCVDGAIVGSMVKMTGFCVGTKVVGVSVVGDIVGLKVGVLLGCMVGCGVGFGVG